MQRQIEDTVVHYVEHGTGKPVLVLHGAGVDHREAEACFEPVLSAPGDLRRIYPDLPGMGNTTAPATLASADDVLEVLLHFADEVVGQEPTLLIGHSAGAYYCQGIAARRPTRVTALALVCPLLAGIRDVPEHRPVLACDDVGDEAFRGYFVIQTPAMLERYRRFVAPAVPLVDADAMERIGEHWQLVAAEGPAYPGPTLVVAGRQDSTVGYAAAVDLLDHYPHTTLVVLDGAGHALPHEKPELLALLMQDWLDRAGSGDQTR